MYILQDLKRNLQSLENMPFRTVFFRPGPAVSFKSLMSK